MENKLYLFKPNKHQMEGILITYKNNVILIDGGSKYDYKQLRDAIKENGSKVDYLLLTHFHADHFGALIELFKDEDIEIKNLVYNYTTKEDTISKTVSWEIDILNEFYKVLEDFPKPTIRCKKNDKFILDGIEILVLNNPGKVISDVNDETVCYKLTFDNGKTMIFLGDLSTIYSEKMYEDYKNTDILDADYLQLAHHGQSGGSYNLYKLINPKYAIWPTPLWLYNNDNGEGYNKGPWTTLETRKWMEEIGTINITAFENTNIIDI